MLGSLPEEPGARRSSKGLLHQQYGAGRITSSSGAAQVFLRSIFLRPPSTNNRSSANGGRRTEDDDGSGTRRRTDGGPTEPGGVPGGVAGWGSPAAARGRAGLSAAAAGTGQARGPWRGSLPVEAERELASSNRGMMATKPTAAAAAAVDVFAPPLGTAPEEQLAWEEPLFTPSGKRRAGSLDTERTARSRGGVRRVAASIEQARPGVSFLGGIFGAWDGRRRRRSSASSGPMPRMGGASSLPLPNRPVPESAALHYPPGTTSAPALPSPAGSTDTRQGGGRPGGVGRSYQQAPMMALPPALLQQPADALIGSPVGLADWGVLAATGAAGGSNRRATPRQSDEQQKSGVMRRSRGGGERPCLDPFGALGGGGLLRALMRRSTLPTLQSQGVGAAAQPTRPGSLRATADGWRRSELSSSDSGSMVGGYYGPAQSDAGRGGNRGSLESNRGGSSATSSQQRQPQAQAPARSFFGSRPAASQQATTAARGGGGTYADVLGIAARGGSSGGAAAGGSGISVAEVEAAHPTASVLGKQQKQQALQQKPLLRVLAAEDDVLLRRVLKMSMKLAQMDAEIHPDGEALFDVFVVDPAAFDLVVMVRRGRKQARGSNNRRRCCGLLLLLLFSETCAVFRHNSRRRLFLLLRHDAVSAGVFAASPRRIPTWEAETKMGSPRSSGSQAFHRICARRASQRARRQSSSSQGEPHACWRSCARCCGAPPGQTQQAGATPRRIRLTPICRHLAACVDAGRHRRKPTSTLCK